MQSVNPDILVWARETAALTPCEAVQKLGIRAAHGVEPLDRLAQLETGKVAPTRPMLAKMSKIYRRSLLTFYLGKPPPPEDLGEDFRTLPDTPASADTALADAVLRDIRVRQTLVRNIMEEEDEARVLEFVGSARIEDGAKALAALISKMVGFELAAYRKCSKIADAVAHLRDRAESVGVFVLFFDNLGNYHTEISVDVFRGFALADNVAPFIAVNANDSKGAQAFTIVHELAHLWLGLTGVSGRLAGRRVEKFCNDVASAFLLPEGVGALKVNAKTTSEEAVELIRNFAQFRNVSSTMVAYTLHRAEALTYEAYEGIAQEFRTVFFEERKRSRERNRSSGGGPRYPIIRCHRAGPALVNFIDRMLGIGAITTTKAGKVLGVSGQNVDGVLNAGRLQDKL